MRFKTARAIDYFRRRGMRFLDDMPEGWKVLKGAQMAPEGYVMIYNGKSIFDKEYQHALLKTRK